MQSEPQSEHRWLQRMVGEWTCEGEAIMEPDGPPMKYEGVERVRSLGGLWILAEAEGAMPGGGTALSLMTLGYDPGGRRFLGTFVASMMTHLWVYSGGLDPTGQVLTLDTEGPGMTGDGSMAAYQDAIELLSDDHRTLRSQVRLPDGSWREFMLAHYRRRA